MNLILKNLLLLTILSAAAVGEIVERNGDESTGVRNLAVDENGRTIGRCTNKKKCMEVCPGNLYPQMVWHCMKPEYCLIRASTGPECEYLIEGFCRRRRLSEVTEEEDSLTSKGLRSGRDLGSIFEVCSSHEECPGICNVFGRCIAKEGLMGYCRVGDLKNEGSYYIGCKKCDIATCKQLCYKDLSCQGFEYQKGPRKCEIHRVRPTLVKPNTEVVCFQKSDTDINPALTKDKAAEPCWGSKPTLVANGYCRDENNKAGIYYKYSRVNSDRSKLRSTCYHFCIGTPGCIGFEIHGSNCEIHFAPISTLYSIPLPNKSGSPECYRMTKTSSVSYIGTY